MLNALKALVLRVAKVPPEPHAPAGSPGSIRIFRAATNFWKYLLVVWGLKQIVAAFVIFFFLSITAAAKGVLAEFLHVLELLAFGLFIVQMLLSLAKTRLDYEMRWYIVTDRSMRLREGILSVREMTFTFANVQNISIRQGPLQRLLGISDVVVRTAGGGSGGGPHGEGEGHIGRAMHIGTLRAVDNAEQVRDLILERLRRLRDAGLGDPDDRHPVVVAAPSGGVDAVRAAARELLEAARAL